MTKGELDTAVDTYMEGERDMLNTILKALPTLQKRILLKNETFIKLLKQFGIDADSLENDS